MKFFLKKNIKSYVFVAFGLLVISFILNFAISSDTVQAIIPQTSQLNNVATKCNGVQGTDYTNCKVYVKNLKNNTKCDELLYNLDLHLNPDDDSVVTKKYFVKPQAFKNCYDKAAEAVATLGSKDCKTYQEDSPNDKKCQAAQKSARYALGCDKNMFREDGQKWHIKPQALLNCKGYLAEVGNLKLSIANADGTTHVSTVAVKDIGTDADTEGLGDSSGSGSTDDSDASVNCQGGPMGWLLCPMIDYMTKTLQICANLIDSLMQVKFLAQKGSSGQIESAWRAFLSLANILLVVAFMVIIYSQATNAGLSNYNVKRMLPRLVVAAILMNVSFYICALAIDISNVVGASVMGLFVGDNSISDSIAAATGSESGSILGGVLGGAALIGLVALILTPVLLSIIVVFVCLVARQIILIGLVLAAPFAFVAWLLPNTEKYFKKWSGLFTQMLVLYPMAMFLFGISLYFANFLGSSNAQGVGVAPVLGDDANSDVNQILIKIIQLIVLCIPLVALPLLIKSSASIMGNIGNYANKFGAGGMGFGKKAGKLGMRGARIMPGTRNAFEAAGQFKGAREQARKKGQARRAVNRSGRLSRVAFGETGRVLESVAAGGQEKLDQEEIANRRALFKTDPNYATKSIDIAKAELIRAHHDNDKAGVRAALAELSQSAPGTNVAHSVIEGFETGIYNDPFDKDTSGNPIAKPMEGGKSMTDAQRASLATGINDNWGAFKDKDAAIAKWTDIKPKEGQPTKTMSDVATEGSSYDGLNAQQISQQTPEALERAVDSTGVSPQMADAILSSPAKANLNSKTIKKLESISSGSSSGTPPTGSNSSGWSSGGTGTSSGEVKFRR